MSAPIVPESRRAWARRPLSHENLIANLPAEAAPGSCKSFREFTSAVQENYAHESAREHGASERGQVHARVLFFNETTDARPFAEIRKDKYFLPTRGVQRR